MINTVRARSVWLTSLNIPSGGWQVSWFKPSWQLCTTQMKPGHSLSFQMHQLKEFEKHCKPFRESVNHDRVNIYFHIALFFFTIALHHCRLREPLTVTSQSQLLHAIPAATEQGLHLSGRAAMLSASRTNSCDPTALGESAQHRDPAGNCQE